MVTGAPHEEQHPCRAEASHEAPDMSRCVPGLPAKETQRRLDTISVVSVIGEGEQEQFCGVFEVQFPHRSHELDAHLSSAGAASTGSIKESTADAGMRTRREPRIFMRGRSPLCK